jgi:class 3 adenylate cyclase/CHASE2 domain-containing sensor protein
VKWKKSALTPVLICAGVTTLICALELLSEFQPRFTFFRRLEWITYDWRVRQAARHSPPVATNLGFVAITDDSIEALLNGSLPYRAGLHWPRHVYGRVVNELHTQGAAAIGFDIVFAELRPDHPMTLVSNRAISSDQFFAQQLRTASNVALAGEREVFPHDYFRTNSLAAADISAQREIDGMLRRTRAFTDGIIWHPLIKAAARQFGCDLATAEIRSNAIILRDSTGEQHTFALQSGDQFDANALKRALADASASSGAPAMTRAFTRARLWQMGILLAARDLGLDLENAVVDLPHGRIEFKGRNGIQRVIPVDREGRMFIDWSVTATNALLTKEVIESLLDQYEARRDGRASEVTNRWQGKLVLVGSTATGNDLTDLGATPLERETYLLSQHWNVANSVLMNRFIRPLPVLWTLILVILCGAVAGMCTWNLRSFRAVLAVSGFAVAYIAVACWLFVSHRLFVPIVLPVACSLLMNHISLITYLVRVEQRERKRTRDLFGRLVSPEVVRELLERDQLSFGGARRRLTVFFADIRGFTKLTDSVQERAATTIASKKLTAQDAAKHFDAEANSVLETVNPYLSAIGDIVISHNGTLDKYIGDCVMGFWGAPLPRAHHACECVHAVIAAQRAVLKLNQSREAENERREKENVRRVMTGQSPLPTLAILTLGSGINTGYMTVGMIGSEAHIMNYTVFGREVNLASRLESASGSARILIGPETFADLQKDDPDLAARCTPQPPLALKGFREPVQCYEVPWRPEEDSPELAAASAESAVPAHGAPK